MPGMGVRRHSPAKSERQQTVWTCALSICATVLCRPGADGDERRLPFPTCRVRLVANRTPSSTARICFGPTTQEHVRSEHVRVELGR
jgi:hypothetical protein